MRKMWIYLTGLLVWVACHKDDPQPPDNTISINGKAIDVQSRQPIQGLGVYVFRKYWVGPWNDTGHWVFETPDSTTTDANGLFSLAYYAKSGTAPELKVAPASIPDGYQKIMQVNDDSYLCALTDGIAINRSDFALTCLPRTWVKFVLSAPPPGWEPDTLFLRAGNLYGAGNGFCGCGERNFAFPFKNAAALTDFEQQTWEIGVDNRVGLDYWIKGNDIKFQNFISVECAWGDTTSILVTF